MNRFRGALHCVDVFVLCCWMSFQASWASLRTEFAALKPAQLHHMLREYNSGKACPSGWSPSPDDAEDAVRTGKWRAALFPFKVSGSRTAATSLTPLLTSNFRLTVIVHCSVFKTSRGDCSQIFEPFWQQLLRWMISAPCRMMGFDSSGTFNISWIL